LKNLSEIRRFISQTAMALSVDAATIPDVVLAVDEAATNIILHGYQGQEGIIEIELAQEGDALVVRLRDEAIPFDPTTVPPPDLTLPLEQRAPGGLGIYLIRQVMDEVMHRITSEGRNELTLVKRGIGRKR
jgi:serine/threonine-protein kinase RsbW